MASVRAFIAVALPQEARRCVQQCQEVLRRAGVRLRWVRSENVHLTLRFIGEVPETSVSAVADAMDRAVHGHCPFRLQVSGYGVFPAPRRPKVVWLGVGGALDRLEALHGDIARELAQCGVVPELRAFQGHLTIGRVAGPLDWRWIQGAFEGAGPIASSPFAVREVLLLQSVLTPRGAVYTPLARSLLIAAGHRDTAFGAAGTREEQSR